jgi:hypothetical protein
MAIGAPTPISALAKLNWQFKFVPGRATVICLDIDGTLIIPGYPFADSADSALQKIKGLVINQKLIDFTVEFCEHAVASGQTVKVYFATARHVPQTVQDMTQVYETYCNHGVSDAGARVKIVTIAHLVAAFKDRGINIEQVASLYDYPCKDEKFHPESNPIDLGCYYRKGIKELEAALVAAGEVEESEGKLTADFRHHKTRLLEYLAGHKDRVRAAGSKAFMLSNIKAQAEKQLKQSVTLLWIDDYASMINDTVKYFDAYAAEELSGLAVLHINHDCGTGHSMGLWRDLLRQCSARTNKGGQSFYRKVNDEVEYGALVEAHEILGRAQAQFSFKFVKAHMPEPERPVVRVETPEKAGPANVELVAFSPVVEIISVKLRPRRAASSAMVGGYQRYSAAVPAAAKELGKASPVMTPVISAGPSAFKKVAAASVAAKPSTLTALPVLESMRHAVTQVPSKSIKERG